jgi:fructokinase
MQDRFNKESGTTMAILGGIEGGGTKWVLGVGTGPDDLETISIPATTPAETLPKAADFFRGKAISALGIGCFGPLNLHPGSPGYGHITSTPKTGWRNTDVLGELSRAIQVPAALDTDVNASALGEARWGAAKGLTDFVYLTVGTGIGGGALVGGNLIHGLTHPEMGHMYVPRDRERDPFPGCCPFHDDCLEGLASGPAIHARWGMPGEELSADHAAWKLEAHYLAAALANIVYTLSPRRIILGGGVMRQQVLFPLIQRELVERLKGYIQASELLEDIGTFVVPPALGEHSGVAGALVLAERALGSFTTAP